MLLHEIDYLEKEKAKILTDVAVMFTDSNQAAVQKSISMWRDEKLIFPEFSAITINGGCFNFQFYLENSDGEKQIITASIWYTFGESRIGFVIPTQLLKNKLDDVISKSFDGRQCGRVSENVLKKYFLFDWIFTDGFASFDTGLKAMGASKESKMVAAMISSKLFDILIHLYSSIATTLAESNQSSIGFKAFNPVEGGDIYDIVIVENQDAAKQFLENRGVKFLSNFSKNQDGPGMRCKISVKKGEKISLGHYETQDSSFDILSCDRSF